MIVRFDSGRRTCPDCGGSGYDPFDGGQCGTCGGLGVVGDDDD